MIFSKFIAIEWLKFNSHIFYISGVVQFMFDIVVLEFDGLFHSVLLGPQEGKSFLLFNKIKNKKNIFYLIIQK